MRQDLQMTDVQVPDLNIDRHDEQTWIDGPAGAYGGPDDGCSIADIASAFGVTPRALRFYESRGLLTPHRDGARRHYSDADRGRLALILKFKALGFTLLEIRTLIELPQAADHGAPVLTRAQCVEQINLLERQKRDIDQALSELRRAYSSHYLQTQALGR